jgi:DNA-binding MarR family transcriptional regulator
MPDYRVEDSHLLVLFEQLNRRVDRDMKRLVRSTLPAGFRGSYGRLLSLIGDRRVRPTELAEGALISKQAVGERLKEVIDLGWVAREPDPTDARATVVYLTPAGRRIRTRLMKLIAQLEAEWAEELGPERFRLFREVLVQVGEPLARHD